MNAKEQIGHGSTITSTNDASDFYNSNTTPSSETAKRKPMHKMATIAVTSMGSLFGNAVSVDKEGRALGSLESRKDVHANGCNFSRHDSGMQGKLSQKERFFGKPWKTRSKVIPNAGNSLWASEVRSLSVSLIENLSTLWTFV